MPVCGSSSIKTIFTGRKFGKKSHFPKRHAITGEFNSREKESIAVSYLWMETKENLPFTKTQTDGFIKSIVLPTLMKFLVGIVGIFVAILVTSPVIPQMFEPGSINLLLSK